jgi:hypothetical protein
MNLNELNLSLSSIVRQELWKDRWKSRYIRRLWHFALYLIPSTILVLTGLLLFGSAGRDDAYITYWPAYTLSRFGQILNYNGDRIEQSSSLLQVVLLAALAKTTGLEMVTLGKLSSIVFGVASVVAIFKLIMKAADRAAGFSAAIITSASPYFVYWSYSGLESTLVSLTGISLIMTVADYSSNQTRPNLLWPTLVMTLFELVRPETSLLLGCLLGSAIVVALLKGRFTEKFNASVLLSRMLILFGIYAITSGVIFVFRLWYFESLFPQPVIAKSDGFSLVSLMNGITYIKSIVWGSGLTMTASSLAMATGAFIVLMSQSRAREFNPYLVFSLLYVAGYFSFVVFSGGDWMEGGRFLVPFIPVSIAFISLALVSATKSKLPLALFTLLLIGIESKSVISFAQHSSTGIPLWSQTQVEHRYDTSEYSWFEKHSRINMRDVPVIQYLDHLVTQIANHHKPVVIMSGQMGMVPYHVSMKHFGEARFIDRFGLTDRTFTNCRVTQRLQKGSNGLQLYHDFYFDNLSALEQSCQLAKPDIIFELGARASERRLADNGYAVMYSQKGIVTGDERWLKGFTVPADALIAVRTDLLDSLDEKKPIFIEFGH